MNRSFANTNLLSPLDSIRKNKGVDALRVYFYKMGKTKKSEASRLINDSRLHFYSLFLLIQQIKTLDFFPHLNTRNKTALSLCGKILKDERLVLNASIPTSPNSSQNQAVLKWMLASGSDDDGLSDDFDEILDAAASLLVVQYKDKTILPLIANMIFKRNKQGTYCHELIWCFCQSRDPNSLKLISQYLDSGDKKDTELSRKILHYPNLQSNNPSIENYSNHAYQGWLKENFDYLYFTSESFQQSSEPEICCVDLGAKYLGKKIAPHNRQMLAPLNKNEQEHLDAFHQLDYDEQVNLCNFAHKVHKQNRSLQNKWSSYPVSKQVHLAQSGLGGIRWL